MQTQEQRSTTALPDQRYANPTVIPPLKEKQNRTLGIIKIEMQEVIKQGRENDITQLS